MILTTYNQNDFKFISAANLSIKAINMQIF